VPFKVYMMDKILKYLIRRALNRHLMWHQQTANNATGPDKGCRNVWRIVLRDAAPSITVAVPTVLSRAVFTTHHGIPGGNPDQVQTHRKQVNRAIGRLRLKCQHERDRMTL